MIRAAIDFAAELLDHVVWSYGYRRLGLVQLTSRVTELERALDNMYVDTGQRMAPVRHGRRNA